MPAAMIRDLAAAVFAVTPLIPNGAFSVETDPNGIDRSRLDALTAADMTRASIGVQDFDPLIQKTIGREQSYAVTEATVNALRARGVASLDANILYGLPHQTTRRITDSVQKLLSLSPDRIALRSYAHVPWMARRQTMIPTDSLPTREEKLQIFDTARRLFAWDGYVEVGTDHFARPGDELAVAAKTGRLRSSFEGYADDRTEVLIGLGASSISRFPQGYAQNLSATSDYERAIGTGRFATGRGHVFSGTDKLRRRMIEALMCDFAISRSEMIERFGATSQSLTRSSPALPRNFRAWWR